MRYAIHQLILSAAMTALALAGTAAVAAAQTSGDGWNILKWFDPPASRGKPPPGAPDRASLEHVPPPQPRGGPIEATDLAPVAALDGSGLPLDLWRGMSMPELEQLLARLDLPPRSPALHSVWRRMLLASASPPNGATADHFMALRLEALYRSGLLADMEEAFGTSAEPMPLAQVIVARKQIGVGARDDGCRIVGSLAGRGMELRGGLKAEVQLLAGYCAAAVGDTAAAGLAANLAREEGVTDGLPLSVLDALSVGTKVHPAQPARVSLLDYRFSSLLDSDAGIDIVQRAKPALLVVLARAEGRDLRLRTAATEAALRLNALPPEAAADVYRLSTQEQGGDKASAGEPIDPVTRRARLFRAIESTQAPELKGQLLRALLEDARRAGIHVQTARMLAPMLTQLWPTPESSPLAEAIVEVGAVAEDYDLARRWAESTPSLQHWLALIDLAQGRARGGRLPALAPVEELAGRGKLNADLLHRLSTVIDALDMEVPMTIWEAAGRVPHPVSGYLPETGVLSELQQASQRKDVARTVLLAMRAIGPTAVDGAGILALGDAIRALKRAGLEADARRLGVEALLALWPRARS